MDLIKESLSTIIGVRFDKELVLNIKNDIIKIDNVKGAYDLILHDYGHNFSIGSVHIGVMDTLNANEIQRIERQIMILMYQKYNIIMTVGIYAVNSMDPHITEMLEKVQNIIQNYSNILQIHGFYFDKQNSLCSLDLVISFDEKEPDIILHGVHSSLSDLYPDITFIVNNDQDFTLS